MDANRSTFGELQYITQARVAQESVLKIMRHGNTAAAFSGDAERADAIFRTYRENSGSDPLETFARSWRSNGPFTADGSCSALFSFCEGGLPKLFEFSSNNIEGTVKPFGVIGNVSHDAQQELEEMIAKIPSPISKPRDRLNAAVSAMQTESIFFNHMERGIGGVYAGSCVDDAGFNWFGPTLYILQSGNGADDEPRPDEIPRIVIAGIASDVLYVINDNRAFPSFFVNPNAGATAELSVEALSELLAGLATTITLKSSAVEYVTFVNLLSHAITVARVPGYGATPSLTIGWEGEVLKFEATGGLAAAINRTGGARFVFHDWRLGAASPKP